MSPLLTNALAYLGLRATALFRHFKASSFLLYLFRPIAKLR